MGLHGRGLVVNGKGDPAVYNDNVFVLPVGDVLGQLRPLELANRFYEHFEDALDFLISIPNKYPFEQHGQVNPFYRRISNDVEGIGEQVFSDSRSAGSEGRLQGIIYVHNTVAVLGGGILLHELMHRWAASITGSVGGHGLSAAPTDWLGDLISRTWWTSGIPGFQSEPVI